MRKLTEKEMTLIAGGDLTTVSVTVDLPPPPDEPPPDGQGPGGDTGGGGGGITTTTLDPINVTVEHVGNSVVVHSEWTVGNDQFKIDASQDLTTHVVTYTGSATDGSNTFTYSESQGAQSVDFSHSFDLPDNIQFTLDVGYSDAQGYSVQGEVVVPF